MFQIDHKEIASMAAPASQWIHVASVSDIQQGEAKAIRVGEGRSVALFNGDGKIYVPFESVAVTGTHAD